MSDYTKTTNFTAKDALATGDPNKLIKGSEHDTEYDAIETSSATKANKVVPGTTDDFATLSATGDLQDSGYGFIDDDTMGTAAADLISSSESIKAYVDAAISTKVAGLNKKILTIGDWDMDTTVSVTVAHGVTLSKIRSIRALIRNDGDSGYYDFASELLSSETSQINLYADATNINLFRATSGGFDSTSFNSTPFNRGWVVIEYTD